MVRSHIIEVWRAVANCSHQAVWRAVDCNKALSRSKTRHLISSSEVPSQKMAACSGTADTQAYCEYCLLASSRVRSPQPPLTFITQVPRHPRCRIVTLRNDHFIKERSRIPARIPSSARKVDFPKSKKVDLASPCFSKNK